MILFLRWCNFAYAMILKQRQISDIIAFDRAVTLEDKRILKAQITKFLLILIKNSTCSRTNQEFSSAKNCSVSQRA